MRRSHLAFLITVHHACVRGSSRYRSKAHIPTRAELARSANGLNFNTRISEEMIMRTIVSALLALSVLAGIAAPASAFDAKSLYQQLDRESGN
jgi:hypothetical protein